MITTALSKQAVFHKNEAVWNILLKNGLAAGHKRQTIKHINVWYLTQSLELVPKIWHAKVAGIFQQLIPAEQMVILDQALDFYVRGDDSVLREYIKGRVFVEFGTRLERTSYGGGAPSWRSRKFSDPLYLTPAGFLHAYPEEDQDLFLDLEQASLALEFYKTQPNQLKLENASYRICSPAILGRIGGAGYKRWCTEVKNIEYTEPRRSLAESHAIYLERGRTGLKEDYSPAYVYALLRKFKAEGLSLVADDLARIVH